MQDKVTIDQALDAFSADQRGRLSARTMRNYDGVVGPAFATASTAMDLTP